MQRCAPGLVSRDDAALVVIDMQERLTAVMSERYRVVAAVTILFRVALLLDWPIVVTRQYPNGLGDIVLELLALTDKAAAEGARIVTVDKTAFCCVTEPAFAHALEEAGRSQVVLAGMETHICVAQTAVALAASGREVFVAADACCSRRLLDHQIALERMREAGVAVTTSEPVAYEAVGRAATDEFRALLRIVKGQ